MTVISVLWGFSHGGFVSFSVHNAYLHMTNVNTTEEKRITPPPVIMILDLYCCVVRKSARMCVHLHVSCFCADRRVCVSCVFERKNKDSIWCEPLSVPVWNASVILRSLFEAARRWSGTRRRAARGPIWGSRSCREPPAEAILSPMTELCHAHQRRHTFIWWMTTLLLYLHLYSVCDSIQYNYMWNKESEDSGRLWW